MKRRYRCALLAIFLVASGAALLYDQFGFVWVAVAEDWTPEQMLQWFASYQEPSQCALSYDIGGVLNRGPTLTFLDGQKTVCVDPPQLAPTPGNCLVYSFGSNGEWSFDDAMASYGCDVHVFDPSVYAWSHRRSNRTRFYRLGIADRDISRIDHPKRWRLLSLGSIRRQLKHKDTVIDYLKMDVEGDEWPVLQRWLDVDWLDPSQPLAIKQLALEVHLDKVQLPVQFRLIRRLEASGFSRFFTRENPWSRTDRFLDSNITVATCFEMAWLNSKLLPSLSLQHKASQGNPWSG